MIGQTIRVIFLITDHGSLITSRRSASATARQSSLSTTTRAKTGGKGIRTPDFQLAKLALYQLSYAPELVVDFRLPIADCKCSPGIAKRGTRIRFSIHSLISGHQFSEQPLSAGLLETGPVICRASNKLRANKTLPTLWKTNVNPCRVRLAFRLW
jgi:hypothetical protein